MNQATRIIHIQPKISAASDDTQDIDINYNREMSFITAIYGIPLVWGWGISAMAGVKFNPHLAVMAVPVFGSLVVADCIGIWRKVRAMTEFYSGGVGSAME